LSAVSDYTVCDEHVSNRSETLENLDDNMDVNYGFHLTRTASVCHRTKLSIPKVKEYRRRNGFRAADL